MEFGLDDKDLKRIRAVFASYPDIERVLIYGSRAKGNNHPASDIDLTLFGTSLTLTTQQRAENDLDDLLLPYKFDISIYHQIANSDIIDHIQRVGKLFYQKS